MVTKPQVDAIKEMKKEGFELDSKSNNAGEKQGGTVDMKKETPPPPEEAKIKGDGSVEIEKLPLKK